MTTQRQICIRATPAHVALRANVTETIEAALKAKYPPPSGFYRHLIQRDVIAIAITMLIPNGLSGIIPHTTERLLGFRLLSHFAGSSQRGNENIAVDVESLHALGTADSRRCLACIPNALPWKTASREERRLIVAANFLRARAWGVAS